MIKRIVSEMIRSRFFKGKAIIVIGSRQSGKTTLIEGILREYDQNEILHLNADEPDVRENLTHTNSSLLKAMIGEKKIVFIDEAQRIKDVGITLKLIVDQIKDIQLVVSGSSALEIANEINEPLTGRKYEYRLYPLSFEEMVNHRSLIEEKRLLEHRLIFGYYPDIVTHQGEEKELLKLLSGSYLYKDLLTLEQIKRPVLLEKILRALALQIGSEISFHELAQLVGADFATVVKYIDLLEKSYVIFKLPALNRNVRNEIKKGRKIYFYDNGIRNAVLGNFNSVASRTDIGPLWENYLISERIKLLHYHSSDNQGFFWRTTQQQEIDYVEQSGENFNVFEIKWNTKKIGKFSKTFLKAYSVDKLTTLHKGNFEEFLLPN